MTEHTDKIKWCIPVTKTLDDALEKAVTLDSHSSKSEFVRDAVRRQLETMGFNPQVSFEKEKANVTRLTSKDTLANNPSAPITIQEAAVIE